MGAWRAIGRYGGWVPRDIIFLQQPLLGKRSKVLILVLKSNVPFGTTSTYRTQSGKSQMS